MPRHELSHLVLSLTVLLAACGGRHAVSAEAAPSDDQVRFFESRVRPILATECAKCHGAQKAKGGLRLDSRTALLSGGDSGPAIVPGKPDESLIITAIKFEGPEMPPSRKLTPAQVASLTEWVKMGAPWPGSEHESASAMPVRRGEFKITDKDRAHWAFQPIVSPPVPAVKDQAWVENPIDAFLLSKLESRGMHPNASAGRIDLIRRATYDLTGLPPTLSEVDAFLADRSPNAYETVVDRLLASPHYGEKWGRHWLDLVRFAETNSYERDDPKPNAWRYRDYVIRAMNRDKPFDRFVREQLAGDELPDADADAFTATGYYRLGIWDDEPTDREQARYDALDDIVATSGQVFLGLTLDCARCHDHKLDPIPQKDYYRFLAFFHNISDYSNGGPNDQLPLVFSAEQKAAHAQAVLDLNRRRNESQAALSAIENEFRAQYQQAQGEGLAHPDLDDLSYRYYRDSWERLPDFNSLKPEDSGPLPLPYFDISLRTRDSAFGFVFEGFLIVPKKGTYTFELDSDDGSRLTVGGRVVAEYDGIHGVGTGQKASVELEAGRLPIRLDYFQNVGGFGLIVAWSGPDVPRRWLSVDPVHKRGKLTRRDVANMIQEYGPGLIGREQSERYLSLRSALEGLKREKVPIDTALGVSERGTSAPETFVLMRGNAHVRGDRVEPGFPVVLGAGTPGAPALVPEQKSSGRRLLLADWIASPENPLTARVVVNRLWQHHFGRGIVRSPNNFGAQGDKPTDPELLNWLAARLLSEGWRLKPLHRLIMTSHAYQMSSRNNPDSARLDPANDRFWRYDMRRLSAEEVRDSVLAITGTLNDAMQGASVYPAIPPEVLASQSRPGYGWRESTIEDQRRRSVYIHVKRGLVFPMMESFDVAETDRSTPVRFATTQPTQALAMLNSAFLNEQAGVLADRLRRDAGDDLNRQVELALRLVSSRKPEPAEVQRGVALIDSLRTQDGITAAEALRSFCLVALNLNEMIYLD